MRTSFQSRTRRGFTLLEVIIAMTLTSTLMVLVWSLLSTYTKLEERSSRAAVELQLVRSLSQQLRSDLEHFAVIPTPVETVKKSSGDGQELAEDAKDEDIDAESETVPETEASLDNDNFEEPQSAEEPLSFENRSSDTLTESPSAQIAMGQGIAVDTDFSREDIYQNSFDASLPTLTYLRGNKTRLEFVTRLPYTVDVPAGNQMLGAETRYGTHQLVLYEFRDPRKLETLLREDPVLNPQRWNPPKPANPNDPMPVANPLNPNDNVGLIREMKSWLYVTRDRRREMLKKQAEAEGLLVDGELPSADPRFANRFSPIEQPTPRPATDRFDDGSAMASAVSKWQPPPEFRHKRDHIPEVTKLQFRYLSGETWVLDWNQDGRLPKAIEIAFDLDPEEPARRAKEFEAAHAAMLGGQSLQQTLPAEDLDSEMEDELEGLDSLLTTNLADPTAIVTEYRFVILLPSDPDPDRDESRSVEVEPSTDPSGVIEDSTGENPR